MWLLTYCFPSCLCMISAVYYLDFRQHMCQPPHLTGKCTPTPCQGMNKVLRFLSMDETASALHRLWSIRLSTRYYRFLLSLVGESKDLDPSVFLDVILSWFKGLQ